MSVKEPSNNGSIAAGKRPLVRFLFSAGGLLTVLVILVLLNVIASRVNFRWDLTADRLYSLSEGSRKVLSNLKTDVTLKFFHSAEVNNLPVAIKNYASRVMDFLSEYENEGKGRITVEIIHPEPDGESEEWAQKYGVQAADLPSGEKVYFGLVALAADQEETIPMLDPSREAQLEYDITRIISRVQSPRRQKIAVISGLPVFGQMQPPMMMGQQPQGSEPWLLIQELRKKYEVTEITTADPIEADLLLVIHPKMLADDRLFAIDQYVLQGGNVIAFVDPLAVSDGTQDQDKSSDLKKLLDAWGVELAANKVVTDFDYPTRLRGQDRQIEENPMWLSLRGEAVNGKDIITGQLESILLPVAGSLKKKEGATVEYEPLLTSSANSALTDSFMARFGGGPSLRKDFKATVDRYDLAVKLRGAFKTAFPGGRPAPAAGESAPITSKEPALTEAKKNATVIVIADADLIFDAFCVSQQNFLGFRMARALNDNLNFVQNACEMLTGDEALIGIRSRGSFERPFTKVQDLEKKAQARWLSREQELMRKVDETNEKLRQLEQHKDASQKLILSPEQEAEVARFQEEKRRIAKELKEVRRNLRAEIEGLGSVLKFINIFLMVFLVAAAGTAYGLLRARRK